MVTPQLQQPQPQPQPQTQQQLHLPMDIVQDIAQTGATKASHARQTSDGEETSSNPVPQDSAHGPDADLEEEEGNWGGHTADHKHNSSNPMPWHSAHSPDADHEEEEE